MSEPIENPPLLTTVQVAKALSLSDETVRRLVLAGKLRPTVSVGRKCRRFKLEDVIRQLAPTAA